MNKLRYLMAFFVALLSLPVCATTWHMATPYPQSNFHTQNILQFAKDVKEATNGKLEIKVHPAGSLIKHKAIKNAVRSHQVQIGEVFVSILANENAVYALDSVPFVATSYEDAKKLSTASMPIIKKDLGRQGIKVLYTVPWPPQGLYTDRPIKKLSDLQGLKFRAYNTLTSRFAELVGAIPTQVEVPDLAQAFTTGRVDAMITATSTGVDTKAWDYLDYFYDIRAYLPKNMVIVNQAAFESLDPSVQKALLAAAEKAEIRGIEMSKKDYHTDRTALAEHGIKVLGGEPLLDGLHSIGDEMLTNWEKTAGEKGRKILEAYRAK